MVMTRLAFVNGLFASVGVWSKPNSCKLLIPILFSLGVYQYRGGMSKKTTCGAGGPQECGFAAESTMQVYPKCCCWRRGWDLNPRGPERPQAVRQFALSPGLLPTWLGYPGPKWNKPYSSVNVYYRFSKSRRGLEKT